MQKAYEDHAQILSNPKGPVRGPVRDEIVSVSMEVFREIRNNHGQRYTKFVPSASSSIQSTSGNGGIKGYVSGLRTQEQILLDPETVETVVLRPDGSDVLSSVRDLFPDGDDTREFRVDIPVGKIWSLRMRSAQVGLNGWRESSFEKKLATLKLDSTLEDPFGGFLSNVFQPVGLFEPGKIRMITKMNAAMATALQPFQGALLSAWKARRESTMDGRSEDLTPRIRAIHVRHPEWRFDSVDFKSATDYLRRDATMACLDGLDRIREFSTDSLWRSDVALARKSFGPGTGLYPLRWGGKKCAEEASEAYDRFKHWARTGSWIPPSKEDEVKGVNEGSDGSDVYNSTPEEDYGLVRIPRWLAMRERARNRYQEEESYWEGLSRALFMSDHGLQEERKGYKWPEELKTLYEEESLARMKLTPDFWSTWPKRDLDDDLPFCLVWDGYREEMGWEEYEYVPDTSTYAVRGWEGQLMGHILSFAFLCVINLACYRYAIKLWRDHVRPGTGKYSRSQMTDVDFSQIVEDLEEGVIVNGDDIVYKSPDADFSRFFWENARDVGFIRSVGKSYSSMTHCQINSQLFRANGNEIDRIGYLNLRIVTGVDVKAVSMGLESLRTPQSVGKEMTKMIRQVPWALSALPYAISCWDRHYPKGDRPNWTFPAVLGGYGLSPELCHSRCTRRQRLRAAVHGRYFADHGRVLQISRRTGGLDCVLETLRAKIDKTKSMIDDETAAVGRCDGGPEGRLLKGYIATQWECVRDLNKLLTERFLEFREIFRAQGEEIHIGQAQALGCWDDDVSRVIHSHRCIVEGRLEEATRVYDSMPFHSLNMKRYERIEKLEGRDGKDKSFVIEIQDAQKRLKFFDKHHYDGRRSFPIRGEYVLGPGERFVSEEEPFGWGNEGLDDVSQLLQQTRHAITCGEMAWFANREARGRTDYGWQRSPKKGDKMMSLERVEEWRGVRVVEWSRELHLTLNELSYFGKFQEKDSAVVVPVKMPSHRSPIDWSEFEDQPIVSSPSSGDMGSPSERPKTDSPYQDSETDRSVERLHGSAKVGGDVQSQLALVSHTCRIQFESISHASEVEEEGRTESNRISQETGTPSLGRPGHYGGC
jgi:hypothetical protein